MTRLLLLLALLVLPLPAAAADSLARHVERQAVAAAVEQVAAPDRFEVVAARFNGADAVEGKIELVLIETRGPNGAGIVQVIFAMRVDGTARGQARATVRGKVLGPALRAATTLPKGRVLRDTDLEVSETDLTRLTEPPLRNAASVTGRVPVRTLARGRVLTGSLLAAAPVVFRGDRVDLRVHRGGLNVVVSAIARQDAAPGEIVPLRNIASGVMLRGRVLADGTADLVDR